MVQYRLTALFKAFGRDVQLAPRIEGGEADMHLTDCNVIIECKSSGKADPEKPGSSRKGQLPKTQREQLADYVEGMLRQQSSRLDLFGLNSQPWLGILTDGGKWWVWRWERKNQYRYPKRPTKLYAHFETRLGDERRIYNQLKKLIYHKDTTGMLRWVPENVASMFEGADVALREVYDYCSGKTTVRNKQEVWLELLKGSGMAPDDQNNQHRLFVLHTYLVVVARAVVSALTETPRKNDPELALNEGFVSWVLESAKGREWVQKMFEEAFQYDWRMRATDVLRKFYEHVIPKADRKVYGEYYTPDWVAEMLAERVLDEKWMESASRAALAYAAGKRRKLDGIGVLDPTCGSGTFLYHAAQRILTSPVLQEKNKQTRADCVALLIHGLDIHPVAVEMARATLLRALPVVPTGGLNALSIAQGDSLLANMPVGPLFQHETGFPNDSKRWFTLPRDFLLLEDYRQRTEALVESAKRAEQAVPKAATANMSKRVSTALEKAHKSLRKLCDERGNSVWTWLIVNTVAPLRLHVRKVDRILANPPWVRMSDIRVKTRKDELRYLAHDLDVWVGGKNATGFDIGSLFVRRCRDLYCVPDGCAGAWVLNWASIKAESWEKFRRWYKSEASGVIVDFSEMREPPFAGANSCAWWEQPGSAATTMDCNKVHEPPSIRTKSNAQIKARSDLTVRSGQQRDFQHKVLRVRDRVPRTEPWSMFAEECTFDVPPAAVPKGVSGYVENEKCHFRNGASLFPHSLVLVESCCFKGARAHFRTKASTKGAWATLGTQEGKVPKHWVVNAVFARDLLPFCLRSEISKAILPLRSRSGVLESSPGEKEAYWKQADRLYQEYRGRGASTPNTLLRRIDYNGILSRQLPLKQGRVLLAYNASGQYLRAAACTDDVIFEHGTYWFTVRNWPEARYLATVLNAPTLETAFAQARKNDRHFDTHIWTAVPIPRYVSRKPLHRKLSILGARAEKVARRARDTCGPTDGQIKTSAAIRQALAKDGVLAEIDRAVQRLLPKQSTKKKATEKRGVGKKIKSINAG